MCSKRYWDAAAVAVSLLIAIGIILLSIFDLLTGELLPILALIFGALYLLWSVLVATSLLRQDSHFDRCVLCKADRVIVPAIALILTGALALLLPSTVPVVPLILYFILTALFVYAALSLGCLLLCLVRRKRDD